MLVRFCRAVGVTFLSLALLTGCSSEKDTQPGLGNVALGLAKAKLGKGKVETAPTAKPAGQVKLSREALVKIGKPVIFSSVPRLGTALPAIQVTRNGAFDTYMGADRATFTITGGIITATRGLFVDLIAQELSLAPAEIFYSGPYPKTYTRTQRHLTGEGVLTKQTYACAIVPHDADETLTLFEQSHTVRQFTELCKNKTRAFQNSYWVDRSRRTIWQSHQSVSKEVGHMILQIVIP
ncbi:MAG: YjbF family lipoprotein [Rhodobacteraceae bacterium]|nr:YjbF family lipoprotein [Paracoccaceae bacterium]